MSELKFSYWSVRQVYIICALMAVVSSAIIMGLTWQQNLDPSLYQGGVFNTIYLILMGCYWFCVTGFIYAMSGLVIRSVLGKSAPTEVEKTAESKDSKMDDIVTDNLDEEDEITDSVAKVVIDTESIKQ